MIEEPSISIEKPNILMFNSDFDQKANFFKLENQVFQSIYRSSARKSHIFITNLILTIDREATCVSTTICKIDWKDCASSEKAVTTSKTLTEYTMRSCTTIASNNCRINRWGGLHAHTRKKES